MVVVLACIDTLDSTFVGLANAVTPTSKTIFPWSVSPLPAIGGATICISQLYFAWRIYGITRQKVLMTVIAGLALIGMVTSIANTVEMTEPKARSSVLPGLRDPVTLLLIINYVSTIIADLLITLTLVWFLTRCKMITKGKKEDSISRFLVFLLKTNIITLIAVTTMLAVFLSKVTTGGSQVALAIFLLRPKLYSNSLLYSLNMRSSSMIEPRATQARAAHSSVDDIEFAVIAFPGAAASSSPIAHEGKSHESYLTDMENEAETETETEIEIETDLEANLKMGSRKTRTPSPVIP